jgi:hypothetical protein
MATVDRLLEGGILLGVRLVEWRANDRDGTATRVDGRMVSGGVDAEREARHDNDSVSHQRACKLSRATAALGRGLARAHDRDGWLPEQREVPCSEELREPEEEAVEETERRGLDHAHVRRRDVPRARGRTARCPRHLLHRTPKVPRERRGGNGSMPTPGPFRPRREAARETAARGDPRRSTCAVHAPGSFRRRRARCRSGTPPVGGRGRMPGRGRWAGRESGRSQRRLGRCVSLRTSSRRGVGSCREDSERPRESSEYGEYRRHLRGSTSIATPSLPVHSSIVAAFSSTAGTWSAAGLAATFAAAGASSPAFASSGGSLGRAMGAPSPGHPRFRPSACHDSFASRVCLVPVEDVPHWGGQARGCDSARIG